MEQALVALAIIIPPYNQVHFFLNYVLRPDSSNDLDSNNNVKIDENMVLLIAPTLTVQDEFITLIDNWNVPAY
jgi:hypothetical protein